jgi:hypothetical protein
MIVTYAKIALISYVLEDLLQSAQIVNPVTLGSLVTKVWKSRKVREDNTIKMRDQDRLAIFCRYIIMIHDALPHVPREILDR